MDVKVSLKDVCQSFKHYSRIGAINEGLIRCYMVCIGIGMYAFGNKRDTLFKFVRIK